jgi:superfamily II helicase
VAITEKIYVKNHRQIGAQLDTRLPRGAFNGATLDLLYQGEGLAELNSATRDRVLAFAEDFLDCGCDTNPYCGHPERKFISYLLECRSRGLGPGAIVDQMEADYLVYAYEGDILSFLDDAARTLEAIESLSTVEGTEEVAAAARDRRSAIVK